MEFWVERKINLDVPQCSKLALCFRKSECCQSYFVRIRLKSQLRVGGATLLAIYSLISPIHWIMLSVNTRNLREVIRQMNGKSILSTILWKYIGRIVFLKVISWANDFQTNVRKMYMQLRSSGTQAFVIPWVCTPKSMINQKLKAYRAWQGRTQYSR